MSPPPVGPRSRKALVRAAILALGARSPESARWRIEELTVLLHAPRWLVQEILSEEYAGRRAVRYPARVGGVGRPRWGYVLICDSPETSKPRDK